MDPVCLYILAHLHRAKVDYAKSISKMVAVPQKEIEKRLNELEKAGLVQKVTGSAIKRSEAKFKLSYEVHKHHTYYTLTRDGSHILRDLKNSLEKYFSEISGFSFAFTLLTILYRSGCEHAGMLAKLVSADKNDVKEAIRRLEDAGLISECKSKIIKRKNRKTKAKKETRTHHTYYTTSRLMDMILRHLS
ncbi:DUF2250 domain-containing protein [Archaeoglobus neptunius]|uniref:DUF2250 domain-containing protein n=1 Tax=Archaeoglobus neptunius TaxID=2798580 RepID=UPI0019269EBF|nr:DUF2250 domain-containing protein [Archaeoglobus neptunius]